MIYVIGGVIASLFALSTIIQSILFCYLEISNNYDDYPYLKINLEILTYYDKKVKEKDIVIKKIRNISLIVSGYSIAIGVIANIVFILLR